MNMFQKVVMPGLSEVLRWGVRPAPHKLIMENLNWEICVTLLSALKNSWIRERSYCK
jgi:hypothetical protein